MKAVSVLSTATLIDTAGNRDYINIYNNGSETLFISYDSDAATAVATLTTVVGWPIPSGTWFSLSNDGNRNVWNKPIYGIVVTGPLDVRIQGA